MKKTLLIIYLLTSPIFLYSEDNSYRDAAQKLIDAFDVKPIEERANDVVMVIKSSGVDIQTDLGMPEETLKIKVIKLLTSEEFTRDMQDLYMRYFTEEELIQIAELLKDPALKKFLSLRLSIIAEAQQVFSSHVEALFQEE